MLCLSRVGMLCLPRVGHQGGHVFSNNSFVRVLLSGYKGSHFPGSRQN